jgi:diketogulonate reductase-like aldo/keto reductase
VEDAVACGFTAIDTANQPKHYQEALVGQALAARFKKGDPRDRFFIQTKFTPVRGQDDRVPYDPKADFMSQVGQSFGNSLENLQTSYLDSYLLHAPLTFPDLGPADWEVWRAMETWAKSGKAKALGISNVNKQQLAALCEQAEVHPAFVQNRCFARLGWDRAVRAFCRSNGIVYQGFSLLTANEGVVQHPEVKKIAKRLQKTVPQVIYRFSIQAGMIPLTGTTNVTHMQEALDVLNFELTDREVHLIETIELPAMPNPTSAP